MSNTQTYLFSKNKIHSHFVERQILDHGVAGILVFVVSQKTKDDINYRSVNKYSEKHWDRANVCESIETFQAWKIFEKINQADRYPDDEEDCTEDRKWHQVFEIRHEYQATINWKKYQHIHSNVHYDVSVIFDYL
ncbi:hypothetical protein HZH66_008598 [Vespula vulgaris]|uniref:Uncharacterized protein n=1 Tax=Vespula vulgaris TaxID=7454 RepID=A0A834N1V9_VESVU|nr:hypothetical protein HZH66_008598 [Vespula vulgaris]